MSIARSRSSSRLSVSRSTFSGSNKLSKKIAEKEGPKNIRTKVGYAHKYVMAHPEAYDWLIKENPAFAAKYVRNESGQIVKRR